MTRADRAGLRVEDLPRPSWVKLARIKRLDAKARLVLRQARRRRHRKS